MENHEDREFRPIQFDEVEPGEFVAELGDDWGLSIIMDQAKKQKKLSSDLKLGRSLGLSHSVISSYRNNKTFPPDHIFAKLCIMAGYDPEERLLMINIRRSEEPAKRIYSKLYEKVHGPLFALLISVLAIGASGPMVNVSEAPQSNHHYGKYSYEAYQALNGISMPS